MTLLLDAGAPRNGVAHVSDAAASVFVEADTAGAVRERLAEAVDWWHLNTAWK